MVSSEVLGTRNHWRAFYGIERPCLADLMVEDRLEEIDHFYPIYHQSLEVAQGVHTENWCVMPCAATSCTWRSTPARSATRKAISSPSSRPCAT